MLLSALLKVVQQGKVTNTRMRANPLLTERAFRARLLGTDEGVSYAGDTTGICRYLTAVTPLCKDLHRGGLGTFLPSRHFHK